MKRSEMLQLIKSTLYSTVYIDVPNNSCIAFDELAEELLQEMEEAGMQPPNITKMPDTWFRSTGDYGYEAAEWETEDEKK